MAERAFVEVWVFSEEVPAHTWSNYDLAILFMFTKTYMRMFTAALFIIFPS